MGYTDNFYRKGIVVSKELAIIVCPECGVKNRIRSFADGKSPVCAKCRTPLLNEKESDALRGFDKKMDDFMNLPDPN